MKLIRVLVAIALVVAGLTALPVLAQGRGAAPGGVPGPPMPMGFPGGAGPPDGMPGSSGHGPPPWAEARGADPRQGPETAATAPGERLSRAMRERARQIAAASPEFYELDSAGALAVRGEVLVSGYDAARLARLEHEGFAVLRQSEVPGLGLTIAAVSHQGMSGQQSLKRLRRIDPAGSFALNHVYFESAAGAVPADAAGAGSAGAADREAVVGLIDTGVARAAEDAPRVRIVRRGFAPSPGPAALHGTAVAELLARRPGRVTIYAADIFGSGPRGGTAELLVQALGWMAAERVPVINVSMVGPANGVVAAATAALIGRGFIIVAPVGNDGAAARPLFPASYPGVVAVTGSDASGRRLPEASRVGRVDFAAPAIAEVADGDGRPQTVRGTSFAAPIVSRALAQYLVAPDPEAARRAIERLARDARRPAGGGNWAGRGLVAAQ